MRQRLMLTAGLLGLALHASAVTHDVMIMDFAFTPPNLNVQVGDTVRWSNHDFFPHTVTALDAPFFNSGTIPSGGTYSFTFTASGLTNYRCNIHTHMTGTVNVASSSATVSGAITLQAFIPSPAGEEVMFEVRNGATVVDTQMVMLGAGGSYSFATSQTGTRAIAAKGSHWLSKSSGNVNLSAGGTTNVNPHSPTVTPTMTTKSALATTHWSLPLTTVHPATETGMRGPTSMATTPSTSATTQS